MSPRAVEVVSAGSPRFRTVAEAFDARDAHGGPLPIERLEAVRGVGLQAAFRRCCLYRIPASNIVGLWHGTVPSRAERIIQEGFKCGPGLQERGGRMHGHGIYFAVSARDALKYCRGEGGLKCLLFCQVALGRVWQASRVEPERRAAPEGADSVASPDRREFVVYSPDQALPAFRLWFAG